MGSTIRMGFIGSGHSLQEIHLPLFTQMEEVTPLVLCDLRESAIKNALRKFGIRETATQWQDVVSMPGLDAVVITLPHDLHALVAERALRAGKHVLCEKPVGLSIAEALAVERAAEESGQLYVVALPYRFDPEVLALQHLVSSGRLGRIHHARAGMIQRDARPGGWFLERERSGGGALIQFGSHLLDLVCMLMDDPQIERVSAVASRQASPTIMREKLDVEDAATVMLRMDSGRSAVVETAWAQDTSCDRKYLEVFGERGGASLWPLRVNTHVDGLASEIAPRISAGNPYQGLVRHFVEAILRQGREPRTRGNIEDGVRLARLTELIYQSVATGREIDVPSTATKRTGGSP